MKTTIFLASVFMATSAATIFSESWNIYDLCQLMTILALSWVLFSVLPYNKLLLKSVAMLYVIDSVWSLLQFYANGSLAWYLELLNIFIFIPWIIYALSRSYEARSVPILDGGVYWLANIPKNISGFIISLFGEPLGGFSLYMDGRLYGYKNGKFEARSLDADRLNVYAIEARAMESESLRQLMQSMVGLKWGFMNNCVTLRLRVWWHHV